MAVPAAFAASTTGTRAASATETLTAPPSVGGNVGFSYEVAFQGLEKQEALQQLLEEVSKTVKNQKKPPVSHFLLQRRARQDLKTFKQALHSRGYFDATVQVTVEGARPPYAVRFAVDPKQRYTLAPPRLKIVSGGPVSGSPLADPDWGKVGLRAGDPAESARIAAADALLLKALQAQGFGHARVVKRRARLDRPHRQLRVVYEVDPGERVRLGGIRIQDSGSADADFLRGRVPWKPDVPFHPDRVEEARQSLIDTGLYNSVRLKLPEQPEEDGLWPLETTLSERKHRTWRLGGGLSTDRGITLKGGWEHRNFRGAAERLRIKGDLGTKESLMTASFEKPDFYRPRQNLLLSVKGEQADEEAYESDAAELSARLTRTFGKAGEISLALSYRLSRVRESKPERAFSYGSASLPVTLKLERRDSALDATRGWRLQSDLAPVLSVSGAGASYLRWRNSGSVYFKLSDAPRLVLAGRGEVGGAFGATRDAIPADDRFYAGGGDSLRGYAYQLAGPLELDGTPRGGRSLLTVGAELRLRVTDKVGVVAFTDAGRTYDSAYPDTASGLLQGVGLGVRYVTPIGPMRLDVAVPLRRRDSIDDAFQVYMSIGQAF